MNFYIAKSIDGVNEGDNNVEIEDELLEYLYSLKKQVPFTMLYSIDPYNDVVIEEETITDIIKMCKYILEMRLLDKYEDVDDAREALNNLVEIGERAIQEKKKLLSIGD
ncbi:MULTISPECIES: hypothetical protein [unclassified Clostridium]|uniref:hypothetical protein n=1 Tax=unclassified Clostridium TaxID=2614128 RepID=UPI00207AF687|nr:MULTISPECIES: hypothetical protein [unclassified Clostridium]